MKTATAAEKTSYTIQLFYNRNAFSVFFRLRSNKTMCFVWCVHSADEQFVFIFSFRGWPLFLLMSIQSFFLFAFTLRPHTSSAASDNNSIKCNDWWSHVRCIRQLFWPLGEMKPRNGARKEKKKKKCGDCQLWTIIYYAIRHTIILTHSVWRQPQNRLFSPHACTVHMCVCVYDDSLVIHVKNRISTMHRVMNVDIVNRKRICNPKIL